ncbi:MAG: SsrA-binding protein SmpB [Candidatus Marinimicrobia bacterium]|nr:SsrA-binding protein SmpB [Candidatus Neomarinimicrobiota bacterium]
MEKLILKNRKAYYDYHILEKIEAGIVLHGMEVKAIREGKINIKEAYCNYQDNELFLMQAHISSYSHAGYEQYDPIRPKKLLLHQKELRRLRKKRDEQQLTLIPLALYWSGNHIKVEIGLAKGKKLYDKRQDIAKRDEKRNLERYMKH